MRLTMNGCGTMRSGAAHAYSASLTGSRCCREQDLQKQVSLAKNQLRHLRASNENNQAKLLDHSQRQGMLRRTSFAPR